MQRSVSSVWGRESGRIHTSVHLVQWRQINDDSGCIAVWLLSRTFWMDLIKWQRTQSRLQTQKFYSFWPANHLPVNNLEDPSHVCRLSLVAWSAPWSNWPHLQHYDPSIPLILIGVTGRWSRSQLTLGEGRLHPGEVASPSQGTYRDTQPFTLTFTLMGNLELHAFGRKLENPLGTHAATGRTCKLHKEGPPRPGIEPTALLLWGDSVSHYTTVQPTFTPTQTNCTNQAKIQDTHTHLWSSRRPSHLCWSFSSQWRSSCPLISLTEAASVETLETALECCRGDETQVWLTLWCLLTFTEH